MAISRYLTSTPNLVGSLLGLGGLGLHLFGVVGRLWPLVVAGLYAAGALATAGTRRSADPGTLAGPGTRRRSADPGTLRRSDALGDRHRAGPPAGPGRRRAAGTDEDPVALSAAIDGLLDEIRAATPRLSKGALVRLDTVVDLLDRLRDVPAVRPAIASAVRVTLPTALAAVDAGEEALTARLDAVVAELRMLPT